MPPTINEEEMYAMDSGYDSDDEPTSADMLEDIRDGSQPRQRVKIRNVRYKICDQIKQIQPEWKGALKATHNTEEDLCKVF